MDRASSGVGELMYGDEKSHAGAFLPWLSADNSGSPLLKSDMLESVGLLELGMLYLCLLRNIGYGT